MPQVAGFSCIVVFLLAISSAAHAQELEPRAYRTLPVGLNFVVLDYSFSTGAVVTEAKLAQAASLQGAILPSGAKHTEPQLKLLPPGTDLEDTPEVRRSASPTQILPSMTDELFGSDNGQEQPKGTGSLRRFRETGDESQAG